MKLIKFFIGITCTFFFLLNSACTTNKYEISGTIDQSFNDKLIMLFKFQNDSITEVDTTVIKNGRFKFTGTQNLDDIAVITSGNFPDLVRSTEVVLEHGRINVIMDTIPKVYGTILNDQYRSYYEKIKSYDFKADSLRKIDPNQAMVKKSDLNLMYEETDNYRTNFIKENLKNPVGRRILKKTMWCLNDSTFYMIYNLLPENYKNESIYVSAIEMRKKSAIDRKERTNRIGQKYIDFELKTPDNKTRKLSDFVGKSDYLFIDFWASWCGPCVADIPHLKVIYAEYKSKGVEFVSISLDSGINSWLSAIEKTDMPWTNLSELKESSDVAKAYNINGIPNGVIIDKNGIIIQSEINSHGLKILLKELIDNKKK